MCQEHFLTQDCKKNFKLTQNPTEELQKCADTYKYFSIFSMASVSYNRLRASRTSGNSRFLWQEQGSNEDLGNYGV